jgi:hypothetical protein
LLVAGVWIFVLPSEEGASSREPPASDAEEDEHEEPAAEVARPSRPSPPAPAPRSAAAPSASAERAPGLPVVGAHPDAPREPGMVPHPIDDERRRIDHLNRLTQALNDAMSYRKVSAMREMLVEFRRLDPEDADKTQAGYEIIADCIEFPGEASLAAAHRFYDTERQSQLRRFVRRICFENSN